MILDQNCKDSSENESYSWFLISTRELSMFQTDSSHTAHLNDYLFQVINYNHVMPTRYSVDISFDKTNLNKELLKVILLIF